ncbi:MAG: hypothetical protein Q7S87_10085 [Agitococcus sp.]|nr:hypothetical protein [Agitococcus sp.]
MPTSTTLTDNERPLPIERVWAEAWGASLDMQGLWLMLGVLETSKKMQAAGTLRSCQAKWFDYIAAQAHQTSALAVPRFTARTVQKIPQFLTLTPSGHVDLTELGRDLANFIYAQHPELQGARPIYESVTIDELGTFPAPLWHFWKSWYTRTP